MATKKRVSPADLRKKNPQKPQPFGGGFRSPPRPGTPNPLTPKPIGPISPPKQQVKRRIVRGTRPPGRRPVRKK